MDRFDDLMAVIKLLADPMEFVGRLGQLKTATEESVKAAEAARHSAEETITRHKSAESILSDAQDRRQEADNISRAADKQNRENALRGENLDKREHEVRQQEGELKAWAARLGTQEDGIRARENAVADREKDAKAAFSRAQALMADYNEAKHKAAIKLAS